MNGKKHIVGFTLMEVLIALFIFTILSTLLMGALHQVISMQSHTDARATQLRDLQRALLAFSRDIEQAIDRQVLDPSGQVSVAFLGEPQSLTLTHMGFANLNAALTRSTLSRTAYIWRDDQLMRVSNEVLDAAPTTRSQSRVLLQSVNQWRFEYLDKKGLFHSTWPLQGESHQPLPQAVRVIFTIKQWGKLSQLYVIPAAKPIQAKPS